MSNRKGVYVPRKPKTLHKNKDEEISRLERLLATERMLHGQTKEQLEIAMRNYTVTQLTLVEQVIKTRAVERKFNWWQKIINRYI